MNVNSVLNHGRSQRGTKRPDRVDIAVMLTDSTGLPNIQVKLREIRGMHFVFQSGSKYYLWNSLLDEGFEITSPQGYNEIVAWLDEGKELDGTDVRAID